MEEEGASENEEEPQGPMKVHETKPGNDIMEEREPGIALSFDTAFAAKYSRTKHKNLRCFPSCSVLHVEQRFCGRSIKATLYGISVEDVEKMVLFGELRNQRSNPLFKVGDPCTKSRISDISEKVFMGQQATHSANETGDYKFVIPPPRKWHYPGKLKDGDLHICQIYLAMNELITATVISPPFSINPVWKNEANVMESDIKRERHVVATTALKQSDKVKANAASAQVRHGMHSSSSSSSLSHLHDNNHIAVQSYASLAPFPVVGGLSPVVGRLTSSVPQQQAIYQQSFPHITYLPHHYVNTGGMPAGVARLGPSYVGGGGQYPPFVTHLPYGMPQQNQAQFAISQEITSAFSAHQTRDSPSKKTKVIVVSSQKQ